MVSALYFTVSCVNVYAPGSDIRVYLLLLNVAVFKFEDNVSFCPDPTTRVLIFVRVPEKKIT